VEPGTKKILEALRAGGGFLALTDSSTPDEITRKLEMSKKTFKKAVGALYRKKIIDLKEGGIELLKPFE
jgi:predicted RNA-binding protein (virulence factor B family)